MATWGASKKRNATTTKSASGEPRALPSGSKRSPAKRGLNAVETSAPARRGGTPGRRRAQASSEIRSAMSGREGDFIGLGMIGIGLLLGLAIYLQLAGPLGNGIEEAVGWLAGLLRFAAPIALVVLGVAIIRRESLQSPYRLGIGSALIILAILGLLHVASGPQKITEWDELGRAGGLLGALVAGPLKALVATAGAVVVMLLIGLLGLMLVTQSSLRTLAGRTTHGVGTVARPIGRRARQVILDLSTLTSDGHDDDDEDDDPAPSGALELPSAGATTTSAVVYDAADDDLGGPEPAPPVEPPFAAEPGAGDADPGLDAVAPAAAAGNWTLPAPELLVQSGNQQIDRSEIERRGQVLQESLAQHGVETTLSGMTVGPTVTRYELELGAGVKVARVTSLQKDIAYAMAAVDVRILAPIPGKSAIGVEVPNQTRQLVALGDLMAAPEAAAANGTLDVGVGKDIAGKAVFLDLAKTPHLLIAGATGAGKSSGINCIITSLLMRTTPDQVRLILIDPKQVEMGQYNRLPHLLTQPVTNPKKAANALGWACKEMDNRYDVLSKVGFRDIGGYNKAVRSGQVQPELGDAPYEEMPYIVVVVDELNDLMMVAARDVEESITRIAQKARAVGIHLIVATQRPSVNVITGVIKANIPARMAFAVSSLTDSRVILDQPGAEKLVGKGDMLLLPGNTSVANRIQGAFVSEEEVRQIVSHWRQQAPEVAYVSGVEAGGEEPGEGQPSLGGIDDAITSSANAVGGGDDDDEAMVRQAMELVVRSQLGSTSMLQRKLKVGFARAGRIMDLLEQRGVVGPSEGSKARAVLMTVQEYELLE